MAQYASRASVNLHTHIFFRGKITLEEGYILFIRQNAIQILIPKYGLEGTLFIPKDGGGFVFNEDVPSQSKGNVTLNLFQKVLVQLTLDQSNVQHEKLEVKLVKPYIADFSVQQDKEPGQEEIKLAKSEKRPQLDDYEDDQVGSKTKKTKWKKKNL